MEFDTMAHSFRFVKMASIGLSDGLSINCGATQIAIFSGVILLMSSYCATENMRSSNHMYKFFSFSGSLFSKFMVSSMSSTADSSIVIVRDENSLVGSSPNQRLRSEAIQSTSVVSLNRLVLSSYLMSLILLSLPAILKIPSRCNPPCLTRQPFSVIRMVGTLSPLEGSTSFSIVAGSTPNHCFLTTPSKRDTVLCLILCLKEILSMLLIL
mmetsp:Transcript_20157/g.28238  ORF Transcript_20157/g.28238 Transcript_20157/m.28238 type:complete len:211 (-) Transcript_20157:507-1139(-)